MSDNLTRFMSMSDDELLAEFDRRERPFKADAVSKKCAALMKAASGPQLIARCKLLDLYPKLEAVFRAINALQSAAENQSQERPQ